MLDSIEEFMNWLTDMDGGWWPFLFLRPAKDVEITTLLVAKMSLYYGIPLGIILAFMFRGFWAIPFSIIFFFIGYRITFAYFWNRRARRLNESTRI